MTANATALPEPRGYLIAPAIVPTVHVVLTPVWMVVTGQSQLAVMAMAWQMIAWFGLSAFCLATLSPALWLMRRRISRFPHRSLGPRHKLVIGIIGSALASLLLVGLLGVRSLLLSWLFAYLSGACFLSALYIKRV
ncbi:MAG: hypothetical protein MK041_10630 [Aquabacterium sp.]|nr:hypothetical protein [Aquabacterium sp.]